MRQKSQKRTGRYCATCYTDHDEHSECPMAIAEREVLWPGPITAEDVQTLWDATHQGARWTTDYGLSAEGEVVATDAQPRVTMSALILGTTETVPIGAPLPEALAEAWAKWVRYSLEHDNDAA